MSTAATPSKPTIRVLEHMNVHRKDMASRGEKVVSGTISKTAPFQ